MAEFKFQNNKKPFTIKDSEDNIIRQYFIDFGEEETLKKVTQKMLAISEIKIENNSIENIDTIKQIAKEIIDTIFNDDFDFLFEACGKNIFSIIELIKELSNFINDSINEKFKKYV